ncbi:MAG TPA: hypothetical protein VEI48_10455 [Candidatus Sulfotelmatobacter sp.]|nr:hypothetical protein [Candidatus Sulfotelmatobacter sp.]
MSNLIGELLLRLSKALAAAVLGAAVYLVAVVILGNPGSIELVLLSWLAASAFILLVEESPI